MDWITLQDFLLQQIPDPTDYYAIRIDGAFSQFKVRSVPVQHEPYPTLAEAIAQQIVFEYEQIQGTMVGIYMPETVDELGIPGFHFHFISADRTRGGHVLGGVIDQAEVSIDFSDGLTLVSEKQ